MKPKSACAPRCAKQGAAGEASSDDGSAIQAVWDSADDDGGGGSPGCGRGSAAAGGGGGGAVGRFYVADSRSYAEQFNDLKAAGDASVLDRPHPRPSLKALAADPSAARVPGSAVYAASVARPLGIQPRNMTAEQTQKHQDFIFFWRHLGFISWHATLLLGAWHTFTWTRLAIGLAIFVVTNGFGVNMTYHRLLSHRSFKVPRALEYLLAYCAVHAMQGDPIEWISNHRYHHKHCDTPLDLHSPYEGFFHAHIGWLLRAADTERMVLDRTNAPDLTAQPFYRHLAATWVHHLCARIVITWFGFSYGALVWTMAFPIVLGWHATFLVNSAAHLWGYQPYDTGDLSRNNWLVGVLSFGDGFHNSHHAFASSARCGLEWWEPDFVYACIAAMRAVGLAWDVKVPSARDKARKRKADTRQTVW